MSISLILGDLHIGKGTSIGRPGIGTGLNSRVVDQINILDWVLDTALDRNVSDIILTGDVFEDPKPAPIYVSIFLDWLKRISISNIRCHIIYGNHDILRSGQFYVSALDLVEKAEIENIFTYNDVSTIHLNKISFTFLPFRDRKSFNTDSNKEALSLLQAKIPYHLAEIPINNTKVCVGHFTLEGSLYVGDEISDMNNELVLPLKMFSGYDYTWMGHIHKPQVLSKKPYISHIGSMDLSDFKESDHIKNIAIINSDTNLVEYINIPTRPLCSISIELPDVEDINKYLISYIVEYFQNNIKNCILKLNIIHSKQSISIDRKFIEDELYKMKVYHIYRISEERKVKQIKVQSEEDIVHSMSELMAIKKWASLNIPKEQQDTFVSLASSIIEDCSER
jgi:exonuclease SbcD